MPQKRTGLLDEPGSIAFYMRYPYIDLDDLDRFCLWSGADRTPSNSIGNRHSHTRTKLDPDQDAYVYPHRDPNAHDHADVYTDLNADAIVAGRGRNTITGTIDDDQPRERCHGLRSGGLGWRFGDRSGLGS